MNTGLYGPLCGEYKKTLPVGSPQNKMFGELLEVCNALGITVDAHNDCDTYYIFEGALGLCSLLWFAAAYRGYELYCSRHFDPDVQADMKLMNADAGGYGVNPGAPMAQPARPYEPPAVSALPATSGGGL